MKNDNTLWNFTETIKTKHDFIEFLKLFQTDLIQKKDDWENQDLESFLFGMERFLEDSTENSLVVVDFTPSWKMFAQLLMTTSIYE